MKNILLFSTPQNIQYTAPRLSCAYLFSIITSFIVVLIPFFLCYSHHHSSWSKGDIDGFWLKYNTYREKPEVRFQYKMIIVADSNTIDKNTGQKIYREIFYSTIKNVNKLRQESTRGASIEVDERDDDLDGVKDYIRINTKIPLNEGEEIYGIQSLIFVDVTFQNHAKMRIDSLIYSKQYSGLAGSGFETRGDLLFHQNEPISIQETPSTLSKRSTIFNEDQMSHYVDETNIRSIIERYQTEKFTTRYNEHFSFWKKSPITVNRINRQNMQRDEKEESFRTFDYTITIDIPTQEILYIPKVGEILIEAWSRYLSILVVIFYGLQRFCSFIYINQLVTTSVKIQ